MLQLPLLPRHTSLPYPCKTRNQIKSAFFVCSQPPMRPFCESHDVRLKGKKSPERYDLVVCAMHQQHRHRCLLDGLHPTRYPTAPTEESPPDLRAQANKKSKSFHDGDVILALRRGKPLELPRAVVNNRGWNLCSTLMTDNALTISMMG
jgi:hypothetical protein